MCWISYIKPEYIVAKKDTVVFKTFDNRDISIPKWWQFWKKATYNSMYYNYTYVKGKLNPSIDIRVSKDESDYGIPLYVIERGYHSYATPRASLIPSLTDAKCIIPKGTGYYQNRCGDIVSENIIIKG